MAQRIDEPLDDQPMIELAVVGYHVKGQPLRLTFIAGNKEHRYRLRPSVAASLIEELADGLAALAGEPGDHS